MIIKSKSEENEGNLLDSITESSWFKILTILSAIAFVIFIGGKAMKIIAGTIAEYKNLKGVLQL